MCFLVSLLPATIWVVLGYFILFSSTKTMLETVQRFGQILAIWVFIIAAFFPVMGAYVTFAGLCPNLETMMKTMHPTASREGSP
jgi:hypothetical protein